MGCAEPDGGAAGADRVCRGGMALDGTFARSGSVGLDLAPCVSRPAPALHVGDRSQVAEVAEIAVWGSALAAPKLSGRAQTPPAE